MRVIRQTINATGVQPAEEIEKMGVSSLRSLLQRQPGIIIRGDVVTPNKIGGYKGSSRHPPSIYQVIGEGVSLNGKLIRLTKEITVKDGSTR